MPLAPLAGEGPGRGRPCQGAIKAATWADDLSAPAVSPGRVVVGEPQDQRSELLGDGRPTRLRCRLSPCALDEAAVPGQERRGGGQSVAARDGRHSAGQGGQ